MARSLDLLPDTGDVLFGVLTNFPEEWSGAETSPNSMGTWPAYHPSALDFLAQLVNWAQVLPDGRQSILLLLDDLDLMTGLNSKIRHDLRWLFRFGPQCHIWPVVAINARRMDQNTSWLEYFHTPILGHVQPLPGIPQWFDNQQAELSGLIRGTQFVMKLADGWLKFRLPAQ
jgi:hypothetical protein